MVMFIFTLNNRVIIKCEDDCCASFVAVRGTLPPGLPTSGVVMTKPVAFQYYDASPLRRYCEHWTWNNDRISFCLCRR